MTKVPQAGTVKTRLQSLLKPEQCRELAVAFLRDAERKAENIAAELIISFSPLEKQNLLTEILRTNPILVGQTGENLGERIFHAFEFAFSRRSDAVVMIGTDSPTVPQEFIEQAYVTLETKSDAVLGKTIDGGFYLIGLRKAEKKIFENVEWSSPQTFEQTKRNIKNLNLNLEEIPVWYDVDLPEDLERLKRELTKNPQIAQKTAEFLESLVIPLNPNI